MMTKLETKIAEEFLDGNYWWHLDYTIIRVIVAGLDKIKNEGTSELSEEDYTILRNFSYIEKYYYSEKRYDDDFIELVRTTINMIPARLKTWWD